MADDECRGGAGCAGLRAQDRTSTLPGFEEQAGPLSRLTLSWFTRLLRMGVTKQLQQEDLGRPHPADEGVGNYVRMQELWDQEVNQHGLECARVGRVLFRFVGRRNVWLLTICAYTSVACLTVQPILTKMLLRWLEGSLTMSVVSQWLLVLAILGSPLLGAGIQAHMNMISSRIGMHLYAALTMMVYRKSLKLSSQARNSASTGRLVNLMSNDAGTVMEQAVRVVGPMLTALPQLVIVLVMLFTEIGISMLTGFGFALFSVPLAILIFKKISEFYGLAAQETDQRLKLVNDLFTGIRVVKAYAWEKAFLRVIGDTRAKELHFIRRHAYWSMVGMMCVYMQLPAFMQLVVYSTYVGLGGEFSASRIFTAIQLFQLLQQPLTQLPGALTQIAQLMTATQRLGAFFRLHELADPAHDESAPPASGEPAVTISGDAIFVWESQHVQSWRLGLPKSTAEKRQEMKATKEARKQLKQESDEVANAAELPRTPADASAVGNPSHGFELKQVDLRIEQGELVAFVGPVGSGKSSLISAILNEMTITAGRVALRGSVAYASQVPWIQNATVRDNILFGLHYDAAWYSEVLDVCALTEDLSLLASGDQTEIGERGINLSGGQKARVSIARAVYSRADIILLDDPLAAVDRHVGDVIFERCVRRALKGKTVILVTNQLERLERVDRVVVLRDGSITESGTHAELMQARGDFADLMERQGIAEPSADTAAAEEATAAAEAKPRGAALGTAPRKSRDGAVSAARITEDESREVGYVNWSVYAWFIRQCTRCLFGLLVCGSMLQTSFPIVGVFLLAQWTEDVRLRGPSMEVNRQWLSLYAAMLVGGLLSSMFSGVCSAEMRVIAARRIHTMLLRTMSRAPVAFFDVTPLGRILNRFSKDMLQIDMTLAMMLSWAIVLAMFVVTSCLAVVVSTRGWMLLLMVPAGAGYLRIFRFVRHSAIEIQRLESISRSPLASTFQEVLAGLTTIRAYRQQGRFQALNATMVNQNVVPFFLSKSAQAQEGEKHRHDESPTPRGI
ncbi:unnamed protein product [Prorocentrum cordatum]|uniref:ATP-dependent transporter ycf16 n=1 Tax=Prorocentrum cordatum TaxID=2364126 RepID=A0ABN9RZU7_9DINO|nr:unnamed protein product [Polarella glacialis]